MPPFSARSELFGQALSLPGFKYFKKWVGKTHRLVNAMAEKGQLINDFCTVLRRRQVEGSLATSKRTAEIMRVLVTSQRHNDANSLIEDVRSTAIKLQAAKPLGKDLSELISTFPDCT